MTLMIASRVIVPRILDAVTNFMRDVDRHAHARTHARTRTHSHHRRVVSQ
jgi:hypothetical protein